jgi:cytochrome c biogenesis protein CcdA
LIHNLTCNAYARSVSAFSGSNPASLVAQSDNFSYSRVKTAISSSTTASPPLGYTLVMLILGIVLIVLGLIFNLHILWIIGVILALLGLVFLIVGAAHPVGGRRWWY